jgi:HEPN domain-containing protein
MIHRSPLKKVDEPVFLSIHLLLGFAVELYLKAFLLHDGMSEKLLRTKQLGHSLKNLYAQGQLRSLPNIPHLEELVDLLHERHFDLRYRYVHEADEFPRTNLDFAFVILNNLDTQIDAVVGASAKFDLLPGH